MTPPSSKLPRPEERHRLEATPTGIPLSDEATLVDALDHLLNRGAVLVGEAVISLADVELVYVGLNLLVSSVETLRQASPPRPLPVAVGKGEVLPSPGGEGEGEGEVVPERRGSLPAPVRPHPNPLPQERGQVFPLPLARGRGRGG